MAKRKNSPRESVDSILQTISRQEEIDPETMERYLDRLDDKWVEGAREKVLDLLRHDEPAVQAAAIQILAELVTNFDLEVLEDFITDPTVGDMSKLSLAPILKELGSELADEGIFDYLNDPATSARRVQARLLDALGQGELGAEMVLKDVVELPEEQRLAFAHWLGESMDPRAIHLLIPLLEYQGGKMLEQVIESIEKLGPICVPYSIPALHHFVATTSHREEKKRAKDAQDALIQQSLLGIEEALQMEAQRYQLPTHEAQVTSIDGSGAQLVMLSWIRPDGLLKGVNTLIKHDKGIKECYGIDEIELGDWRSLLDETHEQGFSNFLVPFEYGRALVLDARAGTKRTRSQLPIGYAVWRAWIEGPQPMKRTLLPYPVALEPLELSYDIRELAADGDELYQLEEFQSWIYDPIENIAPFVTRNLVANDSPESRFWRKAQKKNLIQRSQQAEIIDEAIDALIDEKWRKSFELRLRRQAALFQVAGREKDVPLIRAVAAALHPDSGIPARDQPFVRTFITFSLEQGPMQLLMASMENSDISPLPLDFIE